MGGLEVVDGMGFEVLRDLFLRMVMLFGSAVFVGAHWIRPNGDARLASGIPVSRFGT